MLNPESITPWFVLVAAVCAALTGVAGILTGAYIWLPRGQERMKAWFHDVTGAREAIDIGNRALAEVQTLNCSVTALSANIQTVTDMQAAHHQENTDRADDLATKARALEAAGADLTVEVGALSGNLERTATTLARFTEEHLAEADTRNRAIEAVATLANETAAAMRAHTNARSKHLPARKRGSEPA